MPLKRSTWEGQSLVYQYGCPARVKLDPATIEQFDLAHALRNNLVAAEHRYHELIAAIWLTDPHVAEAQAAVDITSRAVELAEEAIRRERQQTMVKVPSKTLKSELQTVRQARREQYKALKEVKAAAKDNLLPMLKEASTQRNLATTALRKEAVEDGLYWATGNFVLDNHKIAQSRIAASWKEGAPAFRRFKSWQDGNTISVQLQRQTGKPVRSPALLASGEGPWRNVFQLKPWIHPDQWPRGRGKHRHGTLLIKVSSKHQQEIPVIIHRPLPADADVTDVRLTRRFIAGALRVTVSVVVRLPAPQPKTEGPTAAVVLGWTDELEMDGATGWVRLARISTPTGPLLVPPSAEIAPMVRTSADDVTEVFAHPEWRKVLQHTSDIRSIRTTQFDEIKAVVLKSLQEDPQLITKLDLDVPALIRSRRVDTLVWLSKQDWPEGHKLKEILDTWRRRNQHLWSYEAHERRQIIDRRRDTYRKLAAWITDQVSRIVISDTDVAKVKKKPDVATSDTATLEKERRQIQFAAPGEFRLFLNNAAQRRGVAVITEQETMTA